MPRRRTRVRIRKYRDEIRSMNVKNPGAWLLARMAEQSARDEPSGRPDPWDALDRFAEDLRRSDDPGRRRRSLLELARSATGSEAVFLCDVACARLLDGLGDRLPSPRECLAIAAAIRAGDGPRGAVIAGIDGPEPGWLVALSGHRGRLPDSGDARLLTFAGRLFADRARRARDHDRYKHAMVGLIRGVAADLDAKAPGNRGHSERVGRIAATLARALGLSEGEIGDLYVAGLLHDLGKLGLREGVLANPGVLSEEDRAHAREHVERGERLLTGAGPLAYLRVGVRHHHERFDGSGYPDGLAGLAIPTPARVLALAEVLDVMMSSRPTRSALTAERIEASLRSDSGRLWDPRVVAAFLECREAVYRLRGPDPSGGPNTRDFGNSRD
jgi:HD-GYP domain-containing protein (c-di-GMP phosphodiesterase class II)